MSLVCSPRHLLAGRESISLGDLDGIKMVGYDDKLPIRREIDRALSRIADGTYGVCEACDGAIPYRRLKALPATTVCFNCKTRSYRRRAVGMPAMEGILT